MNEAAPVNFTKGQSSLLITSRFSPPRYTAGGPRRARLRRAIASHREKLRLAAAEWSNRHLSVCRTRWTFSLLRSQPRNLLEDLTMVFLRELGFSAERNGPHSLDRGVVDIWLLQEDGAGKLGAVQCQPWNGQPVEVKSIQELAAIMVAQGIDHGAVIAPAGFSKEARRFVEGRNIELIEGRTFVRIIRALPKETQQRLLREVKAEDFPSRSRLLATAPAERTPQVTVAM